MTSHASGSVTSRGGLVVVFALVACWSSAPPPTAMPIGGTGEGGTAGAGRDAQPLEGSYWCAITQRDSEDGEKFSYPKFPCAITREGGHLVLAKLGGSQRFTGDIAAIDHGFRFAGKFYCPWGDCTKPLNGAFREVRDGSLLGKFDDDPTMHVRMWRAAANEFAGAGYAGAMYGGAMYGGAGYGFTPRP